MKPQIIDIYGHYNTDDSGYASGECLGFYQLRAAAESKSTNYYQTVRRQLHLL